MAIYLDNAATSFPKPESVYAAIDQANRNSAIAAGRGTYQRASDSNRIIAQCRSAIAQKINATANQISFAFSGTDALCTAIFGFLNPGDHAIASSADHTSVLRPLWELESRGVQLTIVPCDEHGVVAVEDIQSAIKDNTKLVCLTHASNVTGALQDAASIGQLCQSKGVKFLLDAAQTIGDLGIDVQNLNCDFLAAPGHKGLLGPLGTGFLYTSEAVSPSCAPFRFGGTGSTGDGKNQPEKSPDKFESGNQNVPGIAGLVEALKWLESNEAADREKALTENFQHLVKALNEIENVQLYGLASERTTTLSFNIKGIDCQTIGTLLDSQFQIECRTGLHCAPLIHDPIGATEHGGTVRLSPGRFTTREEIDQTISAVRQIAIEMGAMT